MRPKPPTCAGCPAERVGRGYVPGEGPSDARIAVIGQGPGEQEAHLARPFFPTAPAGWRITHWLNTAGCSRGQVWFDNVVRCWLPKDRAPTVRERRHCWAVHGGLDLPDTVELMFTAGEAATQHLVGKAVHGSPMEVEVGEPG